MSSVNQYLLVFNKRDIDFFFQPCQETKIWSIETSHSILLQPSNNLNSNVFLDSLDDWRSPQDSNCGRKFAATQPAGGIPFSEDVTIDKHGNANMSWHCAGARVSSPGSMLNLKSFLVFSVELLSRAGHLKLSNTPISIYLFGRSFKLHGATLWNGGHYICVLYFKNNWHMYDWLKEYTRKGSGFCSSPTMFCGPLWFTLSFAVYSLSTNYNE